MFKLLWLTFCSEAYLHQLESNDAPSISSDLLKPNSTRALFTLWDPIGLPRDYKEFIPGVEMVFQEGKGLVAIPCAPPFDKEYLAMHYSGLAATNLDGTVFPSIFRAEYSQPGIGDLSSASNYVTRVLEGKLLAHTVLATAEVRPEVNGDSQIRDARFQNISYVATKPGVSNWLDRVSQTLQLEMRSKSGTPIYQRSKTTGKLSEIRED